MNIHDAQVLMAVIEKSKMRMNDAFERPFIQTVRRHIAQGRPLSVRQGKVLEAIYRKSQGGQL